MSDPREKLNRTVVESSNTSMNPAKTEQTQRTLADSSASTAQKSQATVVKPQATIAQTIGAEGVNPSVTQVDAQDGDAAFLQNAKANLPNLPGYEFTGEIARGGMGRILAARDLKLQRDVAIKVLLHDRFSSASRFIRESIVTARLQHPGVPPVHALGTLDDGSPFLAMKLIRGRTLASLLNDRPSPSHDLARFVQVFEQICQAVGFAHSQGIIHRDLKPLNIMVGAFGEVQVMDWGLAREIESAETDDGDRGRTSRVTVDFKHTLEGSVMGTPAYMPPEQARGDHKHMGPWSDVFALGGILCITLTGAPPYIGMTTEALLENAKLANLHHAFARLDACDADVELVNLCKSCLNLEIPKRPANGKAVADAVAAYRASHEERLRKAETERAAAQARADAEAAKAAEQRKRRRTQLMLAGAIGLLIAVTGGFLWHHDLDEEQRKLERANFDASEARNEAKLTKAEATAEEGKIRNREVLVALLDRTEAALSAGDALRSAEPLDQAEKTRAMGGSEALQSRLDRCRVELNMLRELDGIDNDRWTVVDGKYPTMDMIAPRWMKAFGDYGIAVGNTSPEAAAKRINTSMIRERLLTSLEYWFVRAGFVPESSMIVPELRKILMAADPDEFRNEARTTNYPRALQSWASRGKNLTVQPVWFSIGHGGGDRSVDSAIRENLLRTAHKAKPNNFQVLMSLTTLFKLDDKESGPIRAGWCRAALAVQPTNVSAWNSLGVALRDSDDLSGALEAYQQAVNLGPNYASLHNNLGNALKDSGNIPAAITEYREAIRLDKTLASAHNNLGAALVDSGETDNIPGAIASCKEAVRLDKNYVAAHSTLGVALAAAGEYQKAIESYEAAISLDRNYAPAHNNLGTALASSGNRTGAIAAYQEAIRLDPKYVQAHTNLGLVLVETGKVADGIEAHKEAIRIKPRFAPAHNNLGLAFKANRDLPGAIEACSRATDLDPNYAEAFNNLGACLAAAGKLDEALAKCRKATGLKPKYVEAHINVCSLCLDLKKYEEAIAAGREAVRLNNKIAIAHGLLGLALLRSGDTSGARDELRQAATLDARQWEPILVRLPPLPLAPPPRMILPSYP